MSSKHAGRHFWQPVRIRKWMLPDGTFSEETHMHEDWLELFTDLVCVAMFMKMSKILGHQGPGDGCIFIECFLLFALVWAASNHMTLYINRFVSDNLVRLLLLSCVTCGIFLMVLNVNYTAEWQISYFWGFNWGYVLSRLALVALNAEAFYTFSMALGPWCGVGSMILASVWVVLAGLGLPPSRNMAIGIYAFAFLIEWTGFLMSTPVCRCIIKTPSPVRSGINIGHLDARISIFVMVTLGEGIIQTLNVPPPIEALKWRYAYSVAGFALLLVLALLYFDAKPHSIEDHVLRKSWYRAMILKYTMPTLYYFLFLIGTSFEILLDLGQEAAVHAAHPERPHPPEELVARSLSQEHGDSSPWSIESACWLLSISVGCSHLLITASYHLHDGLAGLKTLGQRAFFAFRVGTAVCHFCVPLLVLRSYKNAASIALAEVCLHVILKVPLAAAQLRWNPYSHHPDDDHGVRTGSFATSDGTVSTVRPVRLGSASLPTSFRGERSDSYVEFTEDSSLSGRVPGESAWPESGRSRGASEEGWQRQGSSLTPVGEDTTELSARVSFTATPPAANQYAV